MPRRRLFTTLGVRELNTSLLVIRSMLIPLMSVGCHASPEMVGFTLEYQCVGQDIVVVHEQFEGQAQTYGPGFLGCKPKGDPTIGAQMSYMPDDRQGKMPTWVEAGCAQCPGPNERYGYDRFGRLNETTRITAAGEPIQTLRAELDVYGRTKALTRIEYLKGKPQPGRPVVRYDYGEGPQPTLVARPSVVSGHEHVIRLAYNDAGQPLRVTEEGFSPIDETGRDVPTAITRTTTFGYSRISGRSVLTQIDGPLPNGPKGTPEDSDITRFDYDDKANAVVQVTAPMNWRTRFARDEAGRVAQVLFDDERVIEYRYDVAGDVKEHKETTRGHLLRHLSFRRDMSGRIAESFEHVSGQRVALARQEFDAAGRLKWQAHAEGILRQATYDTEGRLLASTVTAGSILQQERYTYDAHGRLRRVDDNSGSSRELVRNADGKLVATIDPLGRWTRYMAESNGLSILQAANTAKPLAVRYQVDERGRLQTVSADVDAGDGRGPARRIVHRRVVDDFGREVAIDSPDSGRELRRFDATDRLLRAELPDGTVVEQEHDLAGRLLRHAVKPADTARQAGQSRVTRYVYDGPRLARVEHPDQAERYGYDDRGRVKGKTVSLRLNDGRWVDATTRYRYNDRGWLAAQSLPDGSELQYERNARGQILGIYRQAGAWALFGWGRTTVVGGLEADMVGLRRIVYGNGITGHRQRSREGVLARVVYGGAGSQPAGVDDAVPSAVVPVAQAQPVAAAAAAAPGAFGLPPDPRALWDSRLLFDKAGNIVAQAQFAEATSRPVHAAMMYDAQDQLVQALHTPLQAGTGAPTQDAQLWRYHHDSLGNRCQRSAYTGQSRVGIYRPPEPVSRERRSRHLPATAESA